MDSSISHQKSSLQPTTLEQREQVRKTIDAEWKATVRAREFERKRETIIASLGGKDPYDEYTFEKFDPKLNGTEKILQACLDFDPTRANLFILGGQGKGKTHLSTAIARRVLDQGGRGKVFRGKQLAAALKGRRNYATDHDELDAISMLASLDVIVFDDIEDGPDRDGYLSSFKVLLESRKNEKRFGFIITSNKTVAELSEIVGPKIASRIEGEFKNLIIPEEVLSARALLKQRNSRKNNETK